MQYDAFIERTCDYRKYDEPEEVFEAVSQLSMKSENAWMVKAAQRLVESRTESNFQRRF